MPQPRIVRSYFICTASCDYAFNTDWIVHDVHFLGRRHLSVDLCGWEDLLGTTRSLEPSWELALTRTLRTRLHHLRQ